MANASLEQIFMYYLPNSTQEERYVLLRAAGLSLAQDIARLARWREQSLALTSVQQAIMWANAAIAINEGV